jgi:hypothetical protein
VYWGLAAIMVLPTVGGMGPAAVAGAWEGLGMADGLAITAAAGAVGTDTGACTCKQCRTSRRRESCSGKQL